MDNIAWIQTLHFFVKKKIIKKQTHQSIPLLQYDTWGTLWNRLKLIKSSVCMHPYKYKEKAINISIKPCLAKEEKERRHVPMW